MLAPLWQTRLRRAAEEGRELRSKNKAHGCIGVVAVKPGADELPIIEEIPAKQYAKLAQEIEEYFDSVGGNV